MDTENTQTHTVTVLQNPNNSTENNLIECVFRMNYENKADDILPACSCN